MKPLPLLTVSAGLLAMLPLWTNAQQNSPAWELEPTSFLGIDLQGDFLNQVAPCPADVARPDKPCRVATADPNRFEVRGLPYLPISPGYELVATLAGGRVQELVFSGNANSLNLVTDLLTEQFGQPTKQDSHWIKMTSGASYLAEVLSWQGEKVSINFQRQEKDLGKYAVTFSTLPTKVVSTDETPADAPTTDVSKL
ncbi:MULTISPECIES: hypothetical protein [Pseudomonas]|nr:MULTISPECIES: hypothetical protein [Pseudomonas]MBH3358491.1 hypothetical protein [Pseudomonas guariconensis]MDM9594640.1 hypothetical protein [Pseudomonas guariconensis]MDM9607470.1 hypothetical protein [Pseudomonas guariconensis]MDM9612426.1 hypothetical protein [Pseudomonas guariconensis]TYO74842.1 hypothetical protein DQ397_003097 [Pseudomonas sp. CK-NBRI-02]